MCRRGDDRLPPQRSDSTGHRHRRRRSQCELSVRARPQGIFCFWVSGAELAAGMHRREKPRQFRLLGGHFDLYSTQRRPPKQFTLCGPSPE